LVYSENEVTLMTLLLCGMGAIKNPLEIRVQREVISKELILAYRKLDFVMTDGKSKNAT